MSQVLELLVRKQHAVNLAFESDHRVVGIEAPLEISQVPVADRLEEVQVRQTNSSDLLSKLGEIGSIAPILLSLGCTDCSQLSTPS